VKKWSDHHDRHRASYDLLTALAAFIFCFLGVQCGWGESNLVGALDGNRQVLYSALAQICGSLLGFILAAGSIFLLIGSSPRFQIIRSSSAYRMIFQVCHHAIIWLALGTLWAFISLLADTDAHPKVAVTYVMWLLALVCIVRVYRTVWVLRQITTIASLPGSV
jgi:hypothetical protein